MSNVNITTKGRQVNEVLFIFEDAVDVWITRFSETNTVYCSVMLERFLSHRRIEEMAQLGWFLAAVRLTEDDETYKGMLHTYWRSVDCTN